MKIADFGLATTEHVTSDFGCGSTFYMSPGEPRRFTSLSFPFSFLTPSECQQSSPRPFSAYESGPNDIWSLGVILVNLTCGRNPWKRASAQDSTFKAFLRDPHFLRSILPLSPELDRILHRIFECDPKKRITIPELRRMIIHCPRFTTNSYGLPSPPLSAAGDFEQYFVEPLDLPYAEMPPQADPITPPQTPDRIPSNDSQESAQSFLSGSVESHTSGSSSGSSFSEYQVLNYPPGPPPQQFFLAPKSFGGFFPHLDFVQKINPLASHFFNGQVRVC